MKWLLGVMLYLSKETGRRKIGMLIVESGRLGIAMDEGVADRRADAAVPAAGQGALVVHLASEDYL